MDEFYPGKAGSSRICPITKRYICTFANCEKTFSTSGHLSRHTKIHTGEKPHVCPILQCTSRFSRKDNMMQVFLTNQHFTAHKKKIPKDELQLKPVPDVPDFDGRIRPVVDENTPEIQPPKDLKKHLPELTSFARYPLRSISPRYDSAETFAASLLSHEFKNSRYPIYNSTIETQFFERPTTQTTQEFPERFDQSVTSYPSRSMSFENLSQNYDISLPGSSDFDYQQEAFSHSRAQSMPAQIPYFDRVRTESLNTLAEIERPQSEAFYYQNEQKFGDDGFMLQ